MAEPPIDTAAAGRGTAPAVPPCDCKLGSGKIHIKQFVVAWFLQPKDIIPSKHSEVPLHKQPQRQGQAGGHGDGPQSPGTPMPGPGTRAAHKVKLYVWKGDERTGYEVRLTQKPGVLTGLSAVQAALGPGVGYGTPVQLVRCVGPGGVVQVELRKRPEQQQQQQQQAQQGGAGPSAAGDDRAGAVPNPPGAAGGEGPDHDGLGAEAAEEQGQEQAGQGAHAAVPAQGQQQGLARPAAQGQGQGHRQRTAQLGSAARRDQRMRPLQGLAGGPESAAGQLQGQRPGSGGPAGVPGEATPQAVRRDPLVGRPLAGQAPPGSAQGGQRQGGAGGGGMDGVRSEGAGPSGAGPSGAVAGIAAGCGHETQLAQQQGQERAAQALEGEGFSPGGGGEDAPDVAELHAAPTSQGPSGSAGCPGPQAPRMTGGAGAGGVDSQHSNGHAGRPQQAPGNALSHLPVGSLTPANLRGYIASEEQLPPVREGELRWCGLTFHPRLAPEVCAAMDTWLPALGPGGLAEADPSVQQVYVGGLGEEVPGAHRTWAQRHKHVEAALKDAQAVLQRPGLNATDIACHLASLLGWFADWGRAWPQGQVEWEGVEAFWDQDRACMALRATEPGITRSSVIGICSGYVMPADVADTFVSRGFQACSPEVKAEVEKRAGRRDDLTPAWRVLAGSYMADYSVGETQKNAYKPRFIRRFSFLSFSISCFPFCRMASLTTKLPTFSFLV